MSGATRHGARATAGDGSVGRIRYFQIGFQKCGTTAIAAFLNRSGIACVHHDYGRLARRMRANLAAGARPLEGYEEYDAFTNMNLAEAEDWFDGNRHYEALRRAYGGRFILNTRPVERWVQSIMAHWNARLGRRGALAHYERRFGTTDLARVADCWRAEREAHHAEVRAALSAEILLEFDIESDPPGRLCDFVGVARSCARHYRVENPSLNRLCRLAGASVPLAVKRRIPEAAKQPLKRLLRAR